MPFLSLFVIYLALLFPVFGFAVSPADYGLQEGDLISAEGDPDIYIINEHGFKRLFLNPAIFGFYGHLGGWKNVKKVSTQTRDAFPTSLYFKNCEIGDSRVYAVEVTGEDASTLHWLNASLAKIEGEDSNFSKKVFCINNKEFRWYSISVDYSSTSQVLTYKRGVSVVPTQTAPKEKKLVRLADDPKIYYLAKNGVKKHIINAEVFESYKGNRWEDVVVIDKTELASYPTVDLVQKAGDKNVYKLESGKKRLIPDVKTFNGLGLEWNKLVQINEVEFDAYPTGDMLTIPLTGSCITVFQNGSPSAKINIYFYEEGFNSDPQVYDNYVGKVTTKIFGGSFAGENFPGIEPFKSLKNEFNVFSYADKTNDNKQAYNLVTQDLKQSCSGFAAPTDWGASDGNYNIIVFPSKDKGWPSGSRSTKRLNGTTVRLTAADTIYLNGINLYNLGSDPLAHELGHRIGFLDEEYAFFDLYLGAKPIHPNVDSFNCTKWCKGVDTQSACYQQYTKWLGCFSTKFIEKSNEIQGVLQKNNLNYTAPGDYSWWGSCFNAKNINICGQKLSDIVVSYIKPEVQGLNKLPDQEWVSNWEHCKNQHPNVAGVDACDLGLNCGQNVGCYAGTSFSRFLSSKEDQFIMGIDTRTADKFSKHDEEILRYNIPNKIRHIDVENFEK